MSKSTDNQRRFIESLTKGMTSAEIKIVLQPAFAVNSNTFHVGNTLNQNLKGLTVKQASHCIEILNSHKKSIVLSLEVM